MNYIIYISLKYIEKINILQFGLPKIIFHFNKRKIIKYL